MGVAAYFLHLIIESAFDVTKQEKYNDLIAKFLAGESTPEESSELMTWMEASESNRAYFDTMEAVWSAAEPTSETFFENDWESSWTQVENAIQAKPEAKIRPIRSRFFQLQIAAVLLIGLGLSIWYFWQNTAEPVWTNIQTAQAETRAVQLPDGSMVWLNSNSELRYDPGFNPRIVYLEGEGFFEVTHQNGATFQIRSGDAVTTVLGTSFNVRAYPEEASVSVSVVSGKVRVEHAEQSDGAVLLTAGESASLQNDAEEPQIDELPAVNAPSWHTLELKFENQLVKEVVQQLEISYHTKIVLENPAIGNCHFTSVFKTKSLDDILNVLAFTLRLEVKEENQTYILQGAGCE
ncbi:MAG: FecR domain-containing protein [Saprospiraceae bacterium]|nr:FecR domain-containing protein [Saprospiraceae bacterium]